MIDKINRIFAAILKVNTGYYLFCAYIVGMIFIKIMVFPTDAIGMKNNAYTSPDIFLYCIFLFITCNPLYNLFYTSEEKKLQRYTRLGIPQVDPLFYQKISSDIHPIKRLIGYGYALFKIISYTSLGYLMAIGTSAILFL